MPWILLLLISLFCTPLQAAALPGVSADAETSGQSSSDVA